jgi:lipopolysaccharide transport system ATP-binding protein
MGEAAGAGRTVVFVSHSMAAIQSLCTRALWLDSGVLQTSGATQEVVSRYLGHVTNQKTDMLANRQDRQGDGRLRLVSFRVYRDAEDKVLICGDLANIEIGYEAKVGVELENIHLSVGVKTLLEEGVLYLSNDLVGDELSGLPNKGKVVCHLERLPLVAGSYSVNLYCKLNGILSDWIVDAARLEVEEGDFFNTGRKVSASHSKILVQHSWKVVEHETTELS